jgi:uncharacterized membrane protein
MKRNAKIAISGAAAAAAIYAVNRSFSGKRFQTLPYGYGIKLKKSVTIDRPADDLYSFWRNSEHIPRVFDNKLSVEIIDDKRARWMLRTPLGFKLTWTTEITIDRPNEMIGWRSIGRSHLDNAGYIRFDRATGGRGTVVNVALQYNMPGGSLGAALATLFGARPGSYIEEALRKFKQLMEAGEIPTTEGRKVQELEPVEIASEESFPASDAPAWTGTTGPGA